MSKIHFASPGGARLEFNEKGVKLAGGAEAYKFKVRENGHVKYGDIIIVEHWLVQGVTSRKIFIISYFSSDDGLHDHTKIKIKEDAAHIYDAKIFDVRQNLMNKIFSKLISCFLSDI